jgi:hypothetical protein
MSASIARLVATALPREQPRLKRTAPGLGIDASISRANALLFQAVTEDFRNIQQDLRADTWIAPLHPHQEA